MLIVELSITPLGAKESVGDYVAKAIDVIDRSGLNYKFGPMGTCIEGEWDDVMAVVKKCFEKLQSDSTRITFSLKGDWRVGSESRLKEKVVKVEALLGRSLKK